MLEPLLIDQIQEALDLFNRGQKYAYNVFTATIKDSQTNETYLTDLLHELHDHVDLFEHMNEQFLDFLQFQIDWAKQSVAVLDAFGTFQIALISSNTKHVERHLSFLFTCFAMSETSIHDFAHHTLQQLVLIVPLASTLLCPIAEQCFPFMIKEKDAQVIYVQNLLRALSYLPIGRVRFLELILSKLLRMDVHASRQDILQAERLHAENELVFCLEQLDTDDNKMRHDPADKLDWLMLMLLQYITTICRGSNSCTKDSGRLDYHQARLLLKDFMSIFNQLLLPTHDSSHVQFLVFYLCSFHTDFSDEFINNCWKTFISPSVAITVRQAAVCYLSSFIARAKYITIKSTLAITKSMVDWLHAYVSTTETHSSNANPNRHIPFYAICQAVLYIFIYRHQDIARSLNGLEAVLRWRLNRIIVSELNPLKFCLPTVALRFAQLARNYQIVFCYSIVEANQRYSLPEVFSCNDYYERNTSMVPSRVLYSYFPFDPYVLQRSAGFIRPIYNDYPDERDELNQLDDVDRHGNTDDAAIFTPMLMSTTPSSFDPSASLSASTNNARSLPFRRSPGFRPVS